MSKKKKASANGNGHRAPGSWGEQVRRVVLAGVGAVRAAGEEVEGYVNRLVEKGQSSIEDGKKRIGDFLSKRRETARKTLGSLEKKVDSRIEAFYARLNLATRKEVEDLKALVFQLVETRRSGKSRAKAKKN